MENSNLNTRLNTSFEVEENKDQPKNLFDKLSIDIIEHDIFGYLNSKELFFNIRGISVEWASIMKNIWCSKIKEEMIDQVKTIDFIYEKEVLSKTYEFKLEYLFNYRNLLTLYNANTDVFQIIRSQVQESSEDEEFLKLLNLFFEFISFNEAQDYILEKEFSLLNDHLQNEETIYLYKERFIHMISVDNFHEKNESQIVNFREVFNSLNKIHIENISESARLIYALLQGLIEFEILKYDIEGLKNKKKELIKKIQFSTNEWPKKKKFFERAYKLLLYSK